MELNTDQHTDKYFPMFSQHFENGEITHCVYDPKFGCRECICRGMCKVKEEEINA
jgi:hypothetical protein